MKILWLSHLVPYPPKAGVLLRAYHLVRELASRHEVHLLAFNQEALMKPYFERVDFGLAAAERELSKYCRQVRFVDAPTDRWIFGKHIRALQSLVSPTPYTVLWLQDPEFAALAKAWHEQEHFDLVHCDTISLGPYADLARGAALSLDHHNIESHMMYRRAELERNPAKRWYYRSEARKLESYEREVCAAFDTNLTCSELDSQRLLDICPSASCHTTPNGVDSNFFRPAEVNPDSATFLFVGTLNWYPNRRAVRFLAHDVWPILRNVHPDAKMVVIGTGAPKDVEEVSQRDHRFEVLGFVDDLTPHLAAATAFLCPIDDGGGTKLKLLDAFSAGKAVVANEIACEGLDVVDGDQALFASTAEDYVRQVRRIIEDAVFRRTLESKARAHVQERFSFERIGEDLSNHFLAVAANRHN